MDDAVDNLFAWLTQLINQLESTRCPLQHRHHSKQITSTRITYFTRKSKSYSTCSTRSIQKVNGITSIHQTGNSSDSINFPSFWTTGLDCFSITKLNHDIFNILFRLEQTTTFLQWSNCISFPFELIAGRNTSRFNKSVTECRAGIIWIYHLLSKRVWPVGWLLLLLFLVVTHKHLE